MNLLNKLLLVSLFTALLLGISYSASAKTTDKQVKVEGTTYLVPEGYTITKEDTTYKAEKKKEVEQQLALLNSEPVPTTEELIQWGKQCHPYYVKQNDKLRLEAELLSLS